jgi:MoaA/NifB/PqqE/SkfB family radical SAM enzyme
MSCARGLSLSDSADLVVERPETADLGAPLYVAWQITNECNLACLHCIEESGPGKAFKDELDETMVFDVMKQLMDGGVPYLSFSGGEPMVHPLFFEMVEYVCDRGAQLKVETNGHFLSEANCQRMKDLGVKAVQVSLDGATRDSFNKMRVRGEFNTVIEGMKQLRDADLDIEINYSPTRFNVDEIGRAVDLAHHLGAASFYTGRTMYTGNAVKTWGKLAPSDEQYQAYFATLHAKAAEYSGRMRVHFHEMGLLEELQYRRHHPAALLILLPNGLVKIVNALPFICGDLRKQSLADVWSNFQRAWKDERVTGFIDDMATDSHKTASLHQWIYV